MGEAPKKPVSVILVLLNQSNLNSFLLIKHTTILITYNHHPLSATGYVPKFCSLLSIMNGDFTEGGEKCAPALTELTV